MSGEREARSLFVAAAKVMVVHEGRVLILRRSATDISSPGAWEFAGGRIEFGETPEQAAQREVLEEAGIEAEIGRILFANSFVRTSDRQVLVLSYLGCAKTDKVVLSFEHEDYRWAGKKQLQQLLMPGIWKNLVEHQVFSQPDVRIAEE